MFGFSVLGYCRIMVVQYGDFLELVLGVAQCGLVEFVGISWFTGEVWIFPAHCNSNTWNKLDTRLKMNSVEILMAVEMFAVKHLV